MKNFTNSKSKSLNFNHPVPLLRGLLKIRVQGVKSLNFKSLNLLLLFCFASASLSAQVTIGKNEEPKPYAVLELFSQYETGTYGGLRLPQLTTTQRDALGLTSDADCKGLMIYNLTTNCVETWNGTKWISICGDTTGGGGGITPGETPAQGVVNGANGTILKFMTYNLGAHAIMQWKTADQQAAWTTPADTYGDLYQWGRMADGHEKRTSSTIAGPVSALDANGQPTGTAIGKFITNSSSPYDWRTPQNDNLWGKPKTVQDPCPAGWRVPTYAEWNGIIDNNFWIWQATPVPGYKISPDGETITLFLPAAGYRNHVAGEVLFSGEYGSYWSSTVDDIYARYLFFRDGRVTVYDGSRALGFSVRCVSDL